MNSILSDEDENIMLFGGLSNLTDLLVNEDQVGLNTISITEIDLDSKAKNSDVIYLNFKEDKIISKEFSFEYESPDFDYNEFLSYSDEIISTIKNKVLLFENENETIEEKINDLTNQISEYNIESKSPIKITEDDKEETVNLRKNTNSMEEFKFVLDNRNQLFPKIIEKISIKDNQTNIFLNKTVDNAKEYICLIEQLLLSKF